MILDVNKLELKHCHEDALILSFFCIISNDTLPIRNLRGNEYLHLHKKDRKVYGNYRLSVKFLNLFKESVGIFNIHKLISSCTCCISFISILMY